MRTKIPCFAALSFMACLSFAAAQAAPQAPNEQVQFTVLRTGHTERRIERDIGSGETVYRAVDDFGEARIDAIALDIGSVKYGEYRITDEEPLSARAETRWTQRVGRGTWRTRTETRTVMTATKDAFLLHAELDAYEGEKRVWSHNWERVVPRDLL